MTPGSASWIPHILRDTQPRSLADRAKEDKGWFAFGVFCIHRTRSRFNAISIQHLSLYAHAE
jgi:hypothetical protein